MCVYLEDIVCKYVGVDCKMIKLRNVYLKFIEKVYLFIVGIDNIERFYIYR